MRADFVLFSAMRLEPKTVPNAIVGTQEILNNNDYDDDDNTLSTYCVSGTVLRAVDT